MPDGREVSQDPEQYPVEKKDERVELLLNVLSDVINQACSGYKGTIAKGKHKGVQPDLDSSALSAYARGIRNLAKFGRVEILDEYGRRMLANWRKP